MSPEAKAIFLQNPNILPNSKNLPFLSPLNYYITIYKLKQMNVKTWPSIKRFCKIDLNCDF